MSAVAIAQSYSKDWDGTNPAGPSVTKRSLPVPLDAPPFPFSDWKYGGAPDIGDPLSIFPLIRLDPAGSNGSDPRPHTRNAQLEDLRVLGIEILNPDPN
jgi:hypothetical protein